MTTEAYIYDAIRTPRGRGKAGAPGKPAGSLYEVKPIDLVTNLLESMKERNQLDTRQVDDLILATGEPVNEQGQNIAKTALVYSSWDDITTGAQLHRYCAGGVESMSRLGIGASGAAAGDPWTAMESYGISQGVAADLTARLEGFSRSDLDQYALMSQQRAAHARKNGYFDRSIIPVKDMNGLTILDHDETIRGDITSESLAKLPSSFQMFGDLGHGDLLKFKYPEVEALDYIHTAGN